LKKGSSVTPEVVILVVTYEGEQTIGQLLDSCMADLDRTDRRLLILDNGSKDQTIDVVRSYGLPVAQIEPIGRNVGVAKAFNLGVSKACELGAEWLFILDQDSICGKNCLGRLLQTARRLASSGKVGAVCATPRSLLFQDVVHFPYRWDGRTFKPVCDDLTGDSEPVVSIDSSISSGTLYRLEALSSVGGFREDYFIDFVDHECHMRLRRKGWTLWWEKRAWIYHRLGSIQKATPDGLWIEHAPFRYYYMARNMLEGYWRLGGIKALFPFACMMKRHVRLIRRYGERPRESILFIIKGLGDAILGRFGPLRSGS
jgi:rhamnosyltransferase